MTVTPTQAASAAAATAAIGGGGYGISLVAQGSESEYEDEGEEESGGQESGSSSSSSSNPSKKQTTKKELSPEEKAKREAQEAARKQKEEAARKEQERIEAEKRQKLEEERFKREGPKAVDVTGTQVNYQALTLAKQDSNKNKLVAADIEGNKDWWKWTYDNRWTKKETSTPLDSLFSGINEAYTTLSTTPVTNPTSLNQACHEAYKKIFIDFYNRDHLLNNVGAFCTKLGNKDLQHANQEQPENVTYLGDGGLDGAYNSKFASKGNNKNKLVSPTPKNTSNKNADWWKWNFMKHFQGKTGFAEPFSSVRTPYSVTETETTALNQACNSVYKRQEEITDQGLKNSVVALCTKSRKATDITFK